MYERPNSLISKEGIKLKKGKEKKGKTISIIGQFKII